MNRFPFLFFLLLIAQTIEAPAQHSSVPLDVMTTTVSEQSLDKVPLKISIPGDFHSKYVEFGVMESESGEILFTGTPYDSVRVQIPSNQPVTNQFGDTARLENLKLMYGETKEISAMDVMSPAGCSTLTIPKTGRLYIRLGATLTADEALRGIYTTQVPLSCDQSLP